MAKKRDKTKEYRKWLKRKLDKKERAASASDDAFSGAACEYTDEEYEQNRIDCIVEENWG